MQLLKQPVMYLRLLQVWSVNYLNKAVLALLHTPVSIKSARFANLTCSADYVMAHTVMYSWHSLRRLTCFTSPGMNRAASGFNALLTASDCVWIEFCHRPVISRFFWSNSVSNALFSIPSSLWHIIQDSLLMWILHKRNAYSSMCSKNLFLFFLPCLPFFFFSFLTVLPSRFMLELVKKKKGTQKLHCGDLSILGYCSNAIWRLCGREPAQLSSGATVKGPPNRWEIETR